MNVIRYFIRALTLFGVLASAIPSVAADDELVQVILELIVDADPEIRALGFEQIRTDALGETATRKFAATLSKAPANAQAGLLAALAARGDSAARPEVIQAVSSKEPTTRVAALAALGALGQATDVDILLAALKSDLQVEQAAARKSLIDLRGDESPKAIANVLKGDDIPLTITLIEILAERRALSEIPVFLELATSDQPKVRSAAMAALGKIASTEHLHALARAVLNAEKGAERDSAERALAAVCARNSDANDSGLLAAIQNMPASDRDALLPALGRVGGLEARKVVEAAIADPSRERNELGLRALCNWPDASVAPRLLELHASEKDPKRSAILLAALIRVAPLPDGRTDSERLHLLLTVMNLCSQAEDRAAVLRRTRAIRTIEALRYLMSYVNDPVYAQVACESIVELAHHRALRETNKPEFDVALDKVIATSKDPVVVERAGRYKRGLTWAKPSTAT